jgi:hypothetical protein
MNDVVVEVAVTPSVEKPAGSVTPSCAAQLATSRPSGQHWPAVKQNEPDGQS